MQKYSEIQRATKAILLARVSSKEQEDGYSIDAQKHRLNSYCVRKDFEILRIFEITESSTVGDRKQFRSMIDFAAKHKECIAIVSDKVDRLQRSFKEFPLLEELIIKGKIELHFATENNVIYQDSSAHERMAWTMHVMMAQSYIDSMKDNVKRAFDQKIRNNEWIAQAPIGYLNVKSQSDKSDIQLDLNRAPIIEKLFLEYSTGAFTVGDMVQKAKGLGLRSKTGNQGYLGKSKMNTLLSNPFYYGQMLIKGKLYPHRYPPIISREVFDKCRDVMKGWNRKPFKYAGLDFAFRGLVTCAVTGRTISTDRQTKKYKNGGTGQWNYLRTWNPDQPKKYLWVREETVLSQVEEVFKALKIPQHILLHITEYLKQADKAEQEFLTAQVSELQRQQASAQRRLEKLTEGWLDGDISAEEFKTMRSRLREAQDEAEKLIQAHRNGDDGFKDTMLLLLSTATKAHEIFIGSTTEEKRVLMNHVFQNLSLKGPTLCYELKKPFDAFVQCHDLKEWQGQQDLNLRPTVLETAALPTELYP